MSERQPAVYLMANHYRGTIYTGVTSNLIKRIYEHRDGKIIGFTQRYGCKRLVYYEVCPTMLSAIGWEKQIKAGSRKNKLKLIERQNPQWLDLYDTLF